MSFFKNNKEIKTEDVRLSDYDQIWTKFCFLDETGSLNNACDPFFTIGIIKLSQPYYLSSKLCCERTKRRFYDEMKFNRMSKRNIDFAKFAIGSFFTVSTIPDWYAGLVKPAINPPSWVFGPVWTTLYALIGISFFLISKNSFVSTNKKRMSVIIFFYSAFHQHYLVNYFFRFQESRMGFRRDYYPLVRDSVDNGCFL